MRRRKRKKRRRVEPQKIGQLLEQWLRDEHLSSEMVLYRLIERWPKLVGDRIASRARPTRVDRGRLTVSVANSAWLNELTFLKDGLAEKLNQALGAQSKVSSSDSSSDNPIREIRLVIGRVNWRPRPAPKPPAPPSPPARDAIERALAPLSAEISRHGTLDAELVRAIERARRMQLAAATRAPAATRSPTATR
ncbi:MAG: DUF721 domain-containing protein [Myxococcales bacterium]|nr:DUF721 domain-containing protein [Myxococcales bacterium]